MSSGIVTFWWSRASLRGWYLNRDLEDMKNDSLTNAVDEDQSVVDALTWPGVVNGDLGIVMGNVR